MLRSLHIEDYALIERLEVEFSSGFNVLTGETGSGKSIVVDAVGLLLGDKASSGLIRSGAERARLTGIFIAGFQGASAILQKAGLDASEDEEIIVQRDLLPGGRSRIFVNHQPATAGLLRTLAPNLAEVHGQNEQQQLLQPGEQLRALDSFAGVAQAAEAVAERFESWRQLRVLLQAATEQNEQWRRELDLWQFQVREIDQVSPAAGEDHRLEAEKRVLANSERIQSALASAYDLLYESPQSAIASIASAERHLDQIARFGDAPASVGEAIAAARANIEDAALNVRERLSHWESNPGRLEQVEERLAQLDRLKRKYGPELADVLRHREEVAQNIAAAEAADTTAETLQRQLTEAASEFSLAAGKLSSQRQHAAADFKRAVEKELAALAMPRTQFEARLTVCKEEGEWRGSGCDRVEFFLSPNPGEPLRPLARIASGGEVSRIMLALETVTSTRRTREHSCDDRPTLVFDEVDVGIGGRAAETVGRKLRLLGDTRQVLCVTHLPQIASFAHQHFRVEKAVRSGRTSTTLEPLNNSGRKEELARMLSGTQITPAVLQHAAQLLKANGAI